MIARIAKPASISLEFVLRACFEWEGRQQAKLFHQLHNISPGWKFISHSLYLSKPRLPYKVEDGRRGISVKQKAESIQECLAGILRSFLFESRRLSFCVTNKQYEDVAQRCGWVWKWCQKKVRQHSSDSLLDSMLPHSSYHPKKSAIKFHPRFSSQLFFR